ARRQFDRAMTELRGALQAAGRAVPPAPGPALEASAAGQLARAWRELRRASPWTLRAQGPEKELIVAARDAFAGVLNADAGVRGAALARDLAALAEYASQRHRESKSRRGALDFDDLTRLCRTLLTDDAAACAAERERVAALP